MIIIKDLHKKFGTNAVLKGVSLDIQQGQSLVIIGGSGSGKSVLVKCILGLEQPTSGSITIDAHEMIDASRTARHKINSRIGMLFQHSALFDSLPIWQNVAFRALQTPSLSISDAREIAAEHLIRVGLETSLLDAFPNELSGGSAKRVGLARAIAPDANGTPPDILIFDEPTTGLDALMTEIINDLICECVENLHATTITITHDMRSVRTIADKAALLYRGGIIWQGGQNDLSDVTQDTNPYLYQFMNGLATGPIEVVE
ncbi:MAG: ATP-binding cassette domain-containing protein [Alphaproteobacteria bacterium]|nr:ATP-binding cassette domain-containing protein [Alphaproteobacteria bacterium]